LQFQDTYGEVLVSGPSQQTTFREVLNLDQSRRHLPVV